MKRFIYICLIVLFGCEKEIQIELPPVEDKLVVEGYIEQDQPPYVILTRSVGYFEPTTTSTYEHLFVHDAIITVTDGSTTQTLTELCVSSLPQSAYPLIAQMLGVTVSQLTTSNYCVYTVPLADIIAGTYFKGAVGKTYNLHINSGGDIYTSSTTIPPLIALDTVWFEAEGADTLGFAHGILNDPANQYNAYRWITKRINKGPDGNPKDPNFVPPFGSAFDDKFFDGKRFEFVAERGFPPNGRASEPGEEAGYFKKGDTIVIKFCTIDEAFYKFLRSYESEAYNNGNPFAAPGKIHTNIVGGALGAWGGYGVSYDTIKSY